MSIAGVLAAAAASAATTEVAAVSALQAAIAGAGAGDTIVVENGVYTTAATISVNKVGTAAVHLHDHRRGPRRVGEHHHD